MRQLYIILAICIHNIEIHDFWGLKCTRILNILTDNLTEISTLNKSHVHPLVTYQAKVNTILALMK